MVNDVRAALQDVDRWIAQRRKTARAKQSRFAWWAKVRRVLDVMVLGNMLYRILS